MSWFDSKTKRVLLAPGALTSTALNRPVVSGVLAATLLAVTGILVIRYTSVGALVVPAPQSPVAGHAPAPSRIAGGESASEANDPGASAYVEGDDRRPGAPPEEVADSGTEDPNCRQHELEAFLDETASRTKRFRNDVDRAGGTSQTALAATLSDLKEAKRAYASIHGPECARDAQAKTLVAMQATIDAFSSFLRAGRPGEDGDRLYAWYFTKVGESWDNAASEVALLREKLKRAPSGVGR